MGYDGLAPGTAGLHLADGLALLRPEEQVFAAMLEGWRNQQLARNLTLSTINGREKAVQAFARHADVFPWRWTSALIDEWLGERRAVGNLKRSGRLLRGADSVAAATRGQPSRTVDQQGLGGSATAGGRPAPVSAEKLGRPQSWPNATIAERAAGQAGR